jgi:RNA-directed DNA polymerase
VYIEKEDGRQRPLRVAALEDKIVQQAVVTILNQIYEEDFLGFSYGFRPGRSQHDALDALSYALLKKKVNYVLDADICGFFDNLDKSWLVKFVEHRVADPHSAADPEMAEGRSDGGRQMVGTEDRESAGLGDFTVAREYLPAVLFRSLGKRLAQEVGEARWCSSGMPMTVCHEHKGSRTCCWSAQLFN